ncbi:MAG: hypothetical protein ACTSRU_18715 [Candidatus Hodarchaeales archaeon]
MKTIKITPEWVLEKLSHTLDTDKAGIISLYTGNASDANWIELALSSLEIPFESYDYLSDHKDLVFGFDFNMDDIKSDCPSLYERAKWIEFWKDEGKQVCRNGEFEISENRGDYRESEMSRIVQEFKEQNKIEHITDEEFTDLFGESTLYPNFYGEVFEEYFTYFSISDYDYYLLKNGYNPFTGKFLEDNRADYHIIEGVDTLDSSEVEIDLFRADVSLPIEQRIAQAVWREKYDSYFNQPDGDVAPEFYDLVENDIEYMKVEEPVYLNQGEIECFPESPLDYMNTEWPKISEEMAKKLVKKKDYLKEYEEICHRIEISNIIEEYKELNNIDSITDEELTDLFGESAIFPPLKYDSKLDAYLPWDISEHDFQELIQEHKFKYWQENHWLVEQSFVQEEIDISEGEYEFEQDCEFQSRCNPESHSNTDEEPHELHKAIQNALLGHWDKFLDIHPKYAIPILVQILSKYKNVGPDSLGDLNLD